MKLDFLPAKLSFKKYSFLKTSRPHVFRLNSQDDARVVIFGGFKCRVASFRVAGVALCDIPTCFHKVSKIGLCDRDNTFASFSEDELRFSWQAQHFGDLHLCFEWQAQHFRRVVLRVFCQSHCQGCIKWWQGGIPTRCFIKCRKSVCVTGFAPFSEDELRFS